MYESKLKSRDLDRLFEAILTLKSVEECYMFFEDLCTISELNSIAQRFQGGGAAEGQAHLPRYLHADGASTATISR